MTQENAASGRHFADGLPPTRDVILGPEPRIHRRARSVDGRVRPTKTGERFAAFSLLAGWPFMAPPNRLLTLI